MEKYGDAAVYDAVVIGAGPAGMAAAITLENENPKANVLLLEKMKEPAKSSVLQVTDGAICPI